MADTLSVFSAVGASNHTNHSRGEHDYYATDPIAVTLLCQREKFEGTIWENGCGEGHLSKELKKNGYTVISTDLIDRGYGEGGVDFFACSEMKGSNIVTNPPYSLSKQWVEHSLKLLEKGSKLALFLKIQFLESESRMKLLEENPPKVIYYCAKRITCAMNGDFSAKDKNGEQIFNKDGTAKKTSGVQFYAWYVWEKGWQGETIIKRLEP